MDNSNLQRLGYLVVELYVVLYVLQVSRLLCCEDVEYNPGSTFLCGVCLRTVAKITEPYSQTHDSFVFT